MLEATGTDKAFTGVDDADVAYSWFLDLKEIKYFEPTSKYVSGQRKTVFEKCGLGLTHDSETVCKLAPALMVIDGWNVPIVKGSDFLKNGVKRAIIRSLVTIDDDGEIKSVSEKPSDFWKQVLTSYIEVPEVSWLKKLLSKKGVESDQQMIAMDCYDSYFKRISTQPAQ